MWGRQLTDLRLPDYDVFRSPTPHPLFNVYTAFVSLFGGAAVTVLTLLSLTTFVAMLAGAYEMVRLKIGRVTAVAAVVVLLTRTDLLAYALRSMVDIPFLGLLMWAAVVELRQPRRGALVLVLLGLAGLLRPEAWLLSGVYFVWLGLGVIRPALRLPGDRPTSRLLMWSAVLAAAPPLLWLGLDWLVTGDPLYSFVSTRGTAGDLLRQRPLPNAIALIPRYVGASEPFVNGVGGVIGLALGAYVLRGRMVMLAALGATGIVTYVMIAIGGLSVIPRYLLLSSIVACIGVAYALTAWLDLRGRARNLAIGAAVVTAVVVAVRVPAYLHDFDELSTESRQVRSRIGGVTAIARSSRVEAATATCPPLIAPTHEVVPVLRFGLDLEKTEVIASTEVDAAPTRGTQLLQAGYLDPVGQTNISHPLRRAWTSFPLPGFALVATTDAWLIYTSC